MTSPKLRFKEFDDRWDSIAIGTFLRIKSGLGFKAEEYTTAEEIRLLQIENVGYGNVKWTHNVKYVPNDYLTHHKGLVLNEGDLVLALNRPVTNDQLKIAKLTKQDSPSILYQRVGKLEFIKKEFDTNFIFQIFQKDVKNYVLNSSIGSDQPFISTTDLYKYKLCLPSKEEQTKIASFLSVVDEKITQLTQKHELLSQYKQGMMQKLFSQQIRFRADDGSEFGKWEERKIREIFIEVKDKVLDQDIETYSITAGKGFVSQAEKFGRDISGQQNSNYIVLEKNDFSYNKGNSKTYKYGCVYLNEFEHAIAVPNVFISFRAKTINRINQKFYAKLFEFHYLDRHLRLLISSSARMDGLLNVSKEGFFDINIPCPCVEEQNKIANFLYAIDQKIEVTTQKIKQAKQWKKGLLQQMFV